MLLRRHTSAKHQDQIGVGLFVFLDIAQHSIDSVLGAFTDGTGVEQDQICLFIGVCHGIAQLCQHSTDALSVRNIQLTAKAMHTRIDRVPFCKQIRLQPGAHCLRYCCRSFIFLTFHSNPSPFLSGTALLSQKRSLHFIIA